MSTIMAVVGPSVATKWVVEEEHSERAAAFLNGYDLIAPSHWRVDVAQALWTRVVRGSITAEMASQRLHTLAGAPVREVHFGELLHSAIEVAGETGVTVRESLYVSLALSRECRLVTADKDLFSRLEEAGGPYEGVARWLGAEEPHDQATPVLKLTPKLRSMLDRIAEAADKGAPMLTLNLLGSGGRSLDMRRSLDMLRSLIMASYVETCDHPTVKSQGEPAQAVRITESGRAARSAK